MKIYSDYPGRRTLQIVADVLALTIAGVGIWLGTVVAAAIAVVADLGRQLEDAGAGFNGAMTDAGDLLGQVPFVGESIRTPFDSAGETGLILEDAGKSTQSIVLTTSTTVGVLVAVIILLAVCWVWLRQRIRFALRATEAARLSKLDDGPDLLALRALVSGSRKDLAAADARPVESWRKGDRVVIRKLAQLELRDAGVRIAG